MNQIRKTETLVYFFQSLSFGDNLFPVSVFVCLRYWQFHPLFTLFLMLRLIFLS